MTTLEACLVCEKSCSLIRLSKGSDLGKQVQRYFCDPVIALKKVSSAFEFQTQSQIACLKAQSAVDNHSVEEAIDDQRKHLGPVLSILREKVKSYSSKSLSSPTSSVSAMSVSSTDCCYATKPMSTGHAQSRHTAGPVKVFHTPATGVPRKPVSQSSCARPQPHTIGQIRNPFI